MCFYGCGRARLPALGTVMIRVAIVARISAPLNPLRFLRIHHMINQGDAILLIVVQEGRVLTHNLYDLAGLIPSQPHSDLPHSEPRVQESETGEGTIY